MSDDRAVNITVHLPNAGGDGVSAGFRATLGQHDVRLEPSGALVVQIPGETHTYAPGNWTCVHAVMDVEDQS